MKATREKTPQSGKKRGRPKGSKNKPKDKPTEQLAAEAVVDNQTKEVEDQNVPKKRGRPKGSKNKKPEEQGRNDRLKDANEMMKEVEKRKEKRQQRKLIDNNSDDDDDSYASVSSIEVSSCDDSDKK